MDHPRSPKNLLPASFGIFEDTADTKAQVSIS